MSGINELLDAMPDPAAVDEHWRRICREMVERAAAAEYERGLRDGHVRTIEALKQAQHQAVEDLEAYLRRWHACCRRCRLEGHRKGCPDCQARTRETFGAPHPDDLSPAEMLARARDSCEEPLGLGPGPGWVHLGGRAVHHHRQCAPVCNYRPGWYRLEEAINILSRLPGDYDETLADLQKALAGKAEAA